MIVSRLAAPGLVAAMLLKLKMSRSAPPRFHTGGAGDDVMDGGEIAIRIDELA